jgi:hypothetical protein
VIAGASVAASNIVGSSVASSVVDSSLVFDISVAPSFGAKVINGYWVAVGEVNG